MTFEGGAERRRNVAWRERTKPQIEKQRQPQITHRGCSSGMQGGFQDALRLWVPKQIQKGVWYG